MTGCTNRSSTPPLALISSIASNVAFNWDCSTAEVTPGWENSTPTRHGASVFSLKLITLTWTISSQDGSDLMSDRGKLKSETPEAPFRSATRSAGRCHQGGEPGA